MLLVHDRRWVEIFEVGDEELTKAFLGKLDFYSGTYADAVWHQLVDYDSTSKLSMREVMVMQVARYARQDIERIERMSLQELGRYYDALVNVLSKENALNTEDR